MALNKTAFDLAKESVDARVTQVEADLKEAFGFSEEEREFLSIWEGEKPSPDYLLLSDAPGYTVTTKEVLRILHETGSITRLKNFLCDQPAAIKGLAAWKKLRGNEAEALLARKEQRAQKLLVLQEARAKVLIALSFARSAEEIETLLVDFYLKVF